MKEREKEGDGRNRGRWGGGREIVGEEISVGGKKERGGDGGKRKGEKKRKKTWR